MKQILTLLCVLSCLSSFSQTADQSKTQTKKTPKFVSFITTLDTAQAQKNGFSLNGYIVNISYDRARELHGKKIRIAGRVRVLKGLKDQPSPGYWAGWVGEIKYIKSPKIGIIES